MMKIENAIINFLVPIDAKYINAKSTTRKICSDLKPIKKKEKIK
jgi:hypothetical protein